MGVVCYVFYIINILFPFMELGTRENIICTRL